MACEKNVLEIPVNGSQPNLTDVVIFTMSDGTSVLRTWATILNGIIPDDIEFIVGEGGAPADGESTYQNNSLIGKRVRVYRNQVKQTTLTISGGHRFSHDSVTGTVTFIPALAEEELISIEPY